MIYKDKKIDSLMSITESMSEHIQNSEISLQRDLYIINK